MRLHSRIRAAAMGDQIVFANLLGFAGTNLVGAALLVAMGAALRLALPAARLATPLFMALGQPARGPAVAAELGIAGLLLLAGSALIAAALDRLLR